MQMISRSRVANAQRSIDKHNIHLLEHARGHVGQRDGLIALANVYHHREWLERCAICRG